ncbi:uncharacterized protein LOC118199443 isoform X2 [Stegodyphus dumicola]|uniref:uncharacterized protein LOC118199443 isoform X2 n=1 Tax=Stegodyphus dumicola TaxID=202533 RepID=UPI0015B21DC8|nr:uncharacterized protein LOC118199443 isoform X2 [Stegodyphus dumicola]
MAETCDLAMTSEVHYHDQGQGSLYVDDLQISCQGADMRYVERRLQITLNRIQKWSDGEGFMFSKEKTVCVHFCKKQNLHPEPELYHGLLIPVLSEVKFLGAVFDRKLAFLRHVLYLRKKCFKIVNLLKVLRTPPGVQKHGSLLHIFKSLVRAKLDYGSTVYGFAQPSVLVKLDPIHHQAPEVREFSELLLSRAYMLIVMNWCFNYGMSNCLFTSIFNIMSQSDHPLQVCSP